MLSRLLSTPAIVQSPSPVLLAFRQFVKTTQNASRFAARSREGGIGVGTKTGATLRERLLGPTTGKPFAIGSAAVAGGSLLGIGALCYYGLGLSKSPSIMSQAGVWPQYVRDRIKSTYGYLFASLGITAASAVAASRNYRISRLVTVSPFITLGAVIASSLLVSFIAYENTIPKHAAWALHAGVMGAMLGPMCWLGGPLLVRAAWYTAAIVAGLSTIALTAPSEKFLMMGGPLAMGLAVVFAANIGTFFLPPTTALGAGLMSITIYGGLILFSLFLLFDTQLVVKRATTHPIAGTAEEYKYKSGFYGGGLGQGFAERPAATFRQYDPINSQLSIYADVLNIFIRMAMILMGSQGGRRR